mmetsp:Transcript_25314/g.83681  ORF Transcript_25314/g.83681 Transcript_25314/m.83681 type:complete len:123 (-) Transcript_25314:320-688(-)
MIRETPWKVCERFLATHAVSSARYLKGNDLNPSFSSSKCVHISLSTDAYYFSILIRTPATPLHLLVLLRGSWNLGLVAFQIGYQRLHLILLELFESLRDDRVFVGFKLLGVGHVLCTNPEDV